MNITLLGFDKHFNELFGQRKENGVIPARVTGHSRHFYTVICEKGALSAKLSGSIRFNSSLKSELPAVGDWVTISIRRDKAFILSVLNRKTCFSRRSSGNITEEQVICANIDVVFIVMSLDENFNLRRLQRYISTSVSSGATPIILLNKSDICEQKDFLLESVKRIAEGIEVHAISSRNPDVLNILNNLIKPGLTAVFTGSSGVGKSTLINVLVGEHRQATAEISSAVKKGKHTTSSRELIILPTGGIVIDTPGMRELQMWEIEESEGFKKIEKLAADCRFTDCRHETEPDCSVKKAISDGLLDQTILNMWRTQSDEIEEFKQKKDESVRILENRKSKKRKNNSSDYC